MHLKRDISWFLQSLQLQIQLALRYGNWGCGELAREREPMLALLAGRDVLPMPFGASQMMEFGVVGDCTS